MYLSEFGDLRNKIKNDIRTAYRQYCETVEQNIQTDATAFWNFIRSKKQSNSESNEL